MNVEYYRDLVRPLVAGRKFILTGDVLAAFARFVPSLRGLGAERPYIIAGGRGTGTLPDPADTEWSIVETSGTDMIDSFRQVRAMLTNLPVEVRQALDRWDPKHEAVVLGHPLFTVDNVAGRRLWGARRPAWEALEDKVRVDAVWDAAGVPREESMVVSAMPEELRIAHHQLDRGLGTVLAGDAKEGFNGGAVYLRLVKNDGDIEQAHPFFSTHCDRVRAMPFLEGIPCSIQGIVFPDEVIAFRPVELIVLRPESGMMLRYAGTASFWDPADDDRAFMRDTAKAVGHFLRDAVDYRGGFTIDGIMTVDGFRPTELNTRSGASAGALLAGIRDLPFGLLQRAIIEDMDLDYRPLALERFIVRSADEHRSGAAYTVVDRSQDETVTEHVAAGAGGYHVSAEDDSPDGKLELGPSQLGAFIRFQPDPDSVPIGPSFAPRAAQALALADRIWDLGLGPLSPARSVR